VLVLFVLLEVVVAAGEGLALVLFVACVLFQFVLFLQASFLLLVVQLLVVGGDHVLPDGFRTLFLFRLRFEADFDVVYLPLFVLLAGCVF
jgi:hypothetical protein